MNFEEWATGHHIDKTHIWLTAAEAWDAGVKAERERVRFAIDQSRLLSQTSDEFAEGWHKACDEILTLVNWTGDDK